MESRLAGRKTGAAVAATVSQTWGGSEGRSMRAQRGEPLMVAVRATPPGAVGMTDAQVPGGRRPVTVVRGGKRGRRAVTVAGG